ncbi:hypothetical protein [Caldalkalibacillus mannanilyticus]|uniref:hypothetical protein n=1 Tax=Caldalkalibacillus mannanilyticus TaxID=1418 RepID=UPI0004696D57|nr:hypothetical protein [Caldalkalibacillus mannanilyticus]
MTYHAKTQRTLLLFLLIISIASLVFINSYMPQLVGVIFCLFLLLAIFIQYELKIENDYIIYKVLLFSLPLYQRKIYSAQIIKIEFKKIGWATQGVILHVKKSINIRVVCFTPETIFQDLLRFSHEHNLTVFKTKEYELVEKI